MRWPNDYGWNDKRDALHAGYPDLWPNETCFFAMARWYDGIISWNWNENWML